MAVAFTVNALAVACAHRPAAMPAFRDGFIDGSGKSGPAMVALAGGPVVLGARPDEPGYAPDQAQYEAELSPFAIGVTEVTNAEFCEFLNEQHNAPIAGLPAVIIDEGSGIRRSGVQFVAIERFARRPVTRVTWRGAREYCRWLTARTGRRYELPSAAQWEFAARAGSASTWWWGDADDVARHRTRAGGAVDAGSFPPNPWGLRDMTGNVWEWVLDCHEIDFHALAPRRDPVLLDEECLAPEIRGGSYRDGSDFARPGFRANYWWAPSDDSIGFRVARVEEGRQ